LLPAAPAPLARALPCPGFVSDDVDVEVVDVALLSAGAGVAGVDDAEFSLVDVATGIVVAPAVDEAIGFVDVAST